MNGKGWQLTDSLYDIVHGMPKIELHRHLEGSLRLSSMVEIARDHGIEMPEYEVETLRPFVQMMPGEPRTWQNFLAKFRTIRQFFISPAIVRRITREAIIDAANDNIKYLELRFTPKALCNITKCSAHDAVGWVCDTVEETQKDLDIDVRLIVSMNRHESLEIAKDAIEAAIDHMHKGIVAIDLAGVETGHPAYPFRDLFQIGLDAGLNITLHAGEWEGAESVWDAISNVGTSRLGHGIRALEDPGVVNVLVEQGITLEVCPSSNVDSGVVSDLASHQLPVLMASGLRCTINTDDPLVSGISLTDEIVRLIESLRFTLDDVKQMMMNSAHAVFIPDAERRRFVESFRQRLYPEVAEG